MFFCDFYFLDQKFSQKKFSKMRNKSCVVKGYVLITNNFIT